VSYLRFGLALLFIIAGVACFAAIRGVRRVPNTDTRRGLTGLLVTSGVWAAAECGLLLLPGTQAKVVSYIIGLVAGLAHCWSVAVLLFRIHSLLPERVEGCCLNATK